MAATLNNSQFRAKKLSTFFIANTFISNARLKLAKNHANAKQHPKAELLLFENYSQFSSALSFKNNRTYFNPLSDNRTKWSNTLKQFAGNLPTNCLSVFDHFMRLAFKGLNNNLKNGCLCIHEIIKLIIMKMNMEMKNRSHRYDVNRPRSRI